MTEWKVSDVPDDPGWGYRWTGEIRKAKKGELRWIYDRVEAWIHDDPSTDVYFIVEKIPEPKPKRIILEQVFEGPEPGDLYVPTNTNLIDNITKVSIPRLWISEAKRGLIWRIVENNE